MRRAVIVCAVAITVGCAYAESVAFDLMAGAWAIESYTYGVPPIVPGTSTRGGVMAGTNFRFPGNRVAYEAAFNYRGYNGVQTEASAFGFENRLPIYFTGEPLRVYVAPSLGFWRFTYGLGAPPAYGGDQSDFAYTLGGGLGLRVVGAENGSYVDLGYSYQGTKVTGSAGFFASRRLLRAKGNLGISANTGFAVEAGAIGEGWSFKTRGSGSSTESLSTFRAGSPYILIGPHFLF